MPPSASNCCVALTGNPNSGKTTLFNALTGLRAKVGNYAGVTVERKEGPLKGAPADRAVTVLDLPGTYSLSPKSLDEQVSRDVLFHRLPDVPAPAAVVVVVDASNLERNLYYATQVIELGYPAIIALNMMDVAAENGHPVDAAALAKELGVPVLPLVASRGDGVAELRAMLTKPGHPGLAPRTPRTFCDLPARFSDEVATLAAMMEKLAPARFTSARAEALLLLSDEKGLASHSAPFPVEIQSAVLAARQRLDAAGVDWRSAAIEARYSRIGGIARRVVTEADALRETFSDKLDRVLTHRFYGFAIFVALMALMFQSIFTFAEIPMGWMEGAVGWLGKTVGGAIPPGELNDLLVNGVIAGVGAVVVFLPQICLLFLFISLLEDTGYMARAAFLMDRLMSKVGLHGKSFIPMLSSFACAIPGIMATRTIESPKDRLVTILVAPLMSCSARLPVYTVLIAACIPDVRVLGFFKLGGLTMLAMYLLGIAGALGMAWVFKKTLLKGAAPMLIMELPPYKRPVLAVTLRHMWDRSKLFLRRAGTVILGINILLWFLATYPKLEASGQTSRTGPPNAAPSAGDQLRLSFAGRLGHVIEPAIAPLGFDWKMGIGIVASFAAREVFVSTMSVVYNVGSADTEEAASANLAKTMQQEKRTDGSPAYTPLTAVSLMVFYVFALQCVSTVAVVRRETNSWKWPIIQWLYMGALAWGLAFITYQGGRLLGFN
ncbi:MAG: ferrous iron transport protein B [Verrucomicrobia bacterium]|nr:ferrous iron transport protein B [Verrucomicrobiota bacterium]